MSVQFVDVRARFDCRDIARSLLPNHFVRHSRGYDEYRCPFHQDDTPSMRVWADHLHCFGCLDESELIWTSRGLKPIGEISIGDLVLDKLGYMQKVTATQHKRGSVLGISTGSFRHDPVLLTPDHTCFCIKRDEALRKLPYIRKEKGDVRIKFSSRLKRTKRPVKRDINVSEIRADEVEIGDFIVFPVIPDDLRSYGDLESPEIIRPYTSGPRVERVTSLPVNLDTAWLYGMWLAEGSINSDGRNVVFTLALDEADTYAKRIVQILSKHFGLNSTVHIRQERNTSEVICSKVDLATQFEHWFNKGCEHKHVPIEVLLWPRDLQSAFLQGYRDGDGDHRGDSATVSRELAYSIFAIGIQAQQLVGLSKEKTRYQNRKQTWHNAKHKQEWINGFYQDINGTNYYWSPVLSIEEHAEVHNVVDITVENTSSFVTKLGAVHNCGENVDVIGLVAKLDNISLKEAAEKLDGGVGIPPAPPPKSRERKPVPPPSMRDVMTAYRHLPEGIDFYTGRGIGQALADEHYLGVKVDFSSRYETLAGDNMWFQSSRFAMPNLFGDQVRGINYRRDDRGFLADLWKQNNIDLALDDLERRLGYCPTNDDIIKWFAGPKYRYHDGSKPRLFNLSSLYVPGTMEPVPTHYILALTEPKELDVLALKQLGYVVVGIPYNKTLWGSLKHAFAHVPVIYLLRDNDEAGVAKAVEIQAAIGRGSIVTPKSYKDVGEMVQDHQDIHRWTASWGLEIA